MGTMGGGSDAGVAGDGRRRRPERERERDRRFSHESASVGLLEREEAVKRDEWFEASGDDGKTPAKEAADSVQMVGCVMLLGVVAVVVVILVLAAKFL